MKNSFAFVELFVPRASRKLASAFWPNPAGRWALCEKSPRIQAFSFHFPFIKVTSFIIIKIAFQLFSTAKSLRQDSAQEPFTGAFLQSNDVRWLFTNFAVLDLTFGWCSRFCLRSCELARLKSARSNWESSDTLGKESAWPRQIRYHGPRCLKGFAANTSGNICYHLLIGKTTCADELRC